MTNKCSVLLAALILTHYGLYLALSCTAYFDVKWWLHVNVFLPAESTHLLEDQWWIFHGGQKFSLYFEDLWRLLFLPHALLRHLFLTAPYPSLL